MKSASIGTPAASSSRRCERGDKRAGFTLLEALVALTVLLAFAATLGPYLFHARRIMANAEHRLAAQILLRTLLNAPFDREHLANVNRRGELKGLRWHVVAEPMMLAGTPRASPQSWMAYRVIASVSSGPGQIVTAETVRLAKVQ